MLKIKMLPAQFGPIQEVTYSQPLDPHVKVFIFKAHSCTKSVMQMIPNLRLFNREQQQSVRRNKEDPVYDAVVV
jgi:hypothetical protein